MALISRPGRFAALGLLLVLAATGCSSGDEQPSDADEILAAHDLDGLEPRELVETLEATAVTDRPQDLIASVRTDVLAVADDAGNEAEIPLPADEFYVSIAPYVDSSHDCFYHSLTTCLGELGNEGVDVSIVADDGTEIVSETLRTQDNGFFGLWLPRDIDATITIEHEGGSVQAPLATGPEDPTCITTFRLE